MQPDRLHLSRDLTMMDPQLGPLIMATPKGGELLSQYRSQLHTRLLIPALAQDSASQTASKIDAITADLHASMTLLGGLMDIANERELTHYRTTGRTQSEATAEGAMAYSQEADMIAMRQRELTSAKQRITMVQNDFMSAVAEHLSHPGDESYRDAVKQGMVAVVREVRFLHEHLDTDPKEPGAKVVNTMCYMLAERVMLLAHEADLNSGTYQSLPQRPANQVTRSVLVPTQQLALPAPRGKPPGYGQILSRSADNQVVEVDFGKR